MSGADIYGKFTAFYGNEKFTVNKKPNSFKKKQGTSQDFTAFTAFTAFSPLYAYTICIHPNLLKEVFLKRQTRVCEIGIPIRYESTVNTVNFGEGSANAPIQRTTQDHHDPDADAENQRGEDVGGGEC